MYFAKRILIGGTDESSIPVSATFARRYCCGSGRACANARLVPCGCLGRAQSQCLCLESGRGVLRIQQICFGQRINFAKVFRLVQFVLIPQNDLFVQIFFGLGPILNLFAASASLMIIETRLRSRLELHGLSLCRTRPILGISRPSTNCVLADIYFFSLLCRTVRT